MSLDEYRERQRQAYLQRKREREQNGETDDAGVSGRAQRLGSDTVEYPPVHATVHPTAASSTPDNAASLKAAASTAAGAGSNDRVATKESVQPSFTSLSNPPNLSASSSHDEDTSNDALLAQLLAAEMEESARANPPDEVDEATAAEIAKILAAEVEENETGGVRAADESFAERLIQGFGSPVRRHEDFTPIEEDPSDDALARRLQEEEFLRESPSDRLATTQLLSSLLRERLAKKSPLHETPTRQQIIKTFSSTVQGTSTMSPVNPLASHATHANHAPKQRTGATTPPPRLPKLLVQPRFVQNSFISRLPNSQISIVERSNMQRPIQRPSSIQSPKQRSHVRPAGSGVATGGSGVQNIQNIQALQSAIAPPSWILSSVNRTPTRRAPLPPSIDNRSILSRQSPAERATHNSRPEGRVLGTEIGAQFKGRLPRHDLRHDFPRQGDSRVIAAPLMWKAGSTGGMPSGADGMRADRARSNSSPFVAGSPFVSGTNVVSNPSYPSAALHTLMPRSTQVSSHSVSSGFETLRNGPSPSRGSPPPARALASFLASPSLSPPSLTSPSLAVSPLCRQNNTASTRPGFNLPPSPAQYPAVRPAWFGQQQPTTSTRRIIPTSTQFGTPVSQPSAPRI